MLYQARTSQFQCVPETSSIHCILCFFLFTVGTLHHLFCDQQLGYSTYNADPAHMLITDVAYMLQYLVAQLCDKQKPPCVEVIKAALM